MAASDSAACRGSLCSTSASGNTSPASLCPAADLTGHSHGREGWGCERKSKPCLLHASRPDQRHHQGWRVPRRPRRNTRSSPLQRSAVQLHISRKSLQQSLRRYRSLTARMPTVQREDLKDLGADITRRHRVMRCSNLVISRMISDESRVELPARGRRRRREQGIHPKLSILGYVLELSQRVTVLES
jgi:hypothetical protein